MKIKFYLPLILFCLLFALPVFAEEAINDFSAVIKINSDASLDVTETITYDFGEAMKHGIYRDITYKYQARGGNYNLRLNIISVKDEQGNNYQYKVSTQGKDERITIGNPDAQVSGQKIYIINYSVGRAINFFSDRDEVYWNVTGNGWEVPIKQSRAEIIFPGAVSVKGLKSNCYIGASGSTNNCISDRFVFTDNQSASSVVFADDALAPKEGLTAVVGLPKGVIKEPTLLMKAQDMLADNGLLFLPVLALIIMFWLWRKYGRDPQGRGTIIAEYEAPDYLTPAEVGTIIDECANPKDVSAEIVYLAIKGYLKITRLEGGKVFKSADYRFDKLKSGADLTNDFDKTIITSLFAGNTKSVLLSDLKNKFYKDLQAIQKTLYQDVATKHYFKASPSKVRAWYMIAGGALFLLGGLAVISFGGFGFIAFALSGVIVTGFGYFMPVKTATGVLTKEHILGLKKYLTVAEKDRIKFHNAPSKIPPTPLYERGKATAPEKNPAHFEKLLPYAMVLGVEKDWARQFEGIYNQSTGWYNDSTGANFTALMLVNNLSGFQSRANTVLSTAASGGSGLSGGGFSGGGFGGGGGGSW